jgi:hypothetical protein
MHGLLRKLLCCDWGNNNEVAPAKPLKPSEAVKGLIYVQSPSGGVRRITVMPANPSNSSLQKVGLYRLPADAVATESINGASAYFYKNYLGGHESSITS